MSTKPKKTLNRGSILPSILLLSFLGLLVSSAAVEADKKFSLKADSSPIDYPGNYLDDGRTNEFTISLKSEDLLLTQNLYIILESDNSDFYLNIWQSSKRDNVSGVRKVGTYSGNCLFVLGSGYHDGKMDNVRLTGKLYFSIKTISHQSDKALTNYTLKIVTGHELMLKMGLIYTTMMDSSVNNLSIIWTYDGTDKKDLEKLRFQMNAIRTKPGWQMTATLKHLDATYQMNPLFKKAVGGVLTRAKLPVCVEKECRYVMTMNLLNVRMLNLESFFIGKIEKISINHYEDYYDRTYDNNQLTVYELPFTSDMKGLDVSVSLIPVTGSTDLFINVNTLPNNLDSYDFKEEGALAKRITVRWKELEMMKSDKSSLFIAVRSSHPGEYLIKVDAHEEGLRGNLSPGIIESGVAVFNEIANYMYLFEVIQTQEITFDVKLNVNSGNADLFLIQCKQEETCMIEAGDIQINNPAMIRVRDSNHEKNIHHTFTCEHSGHSSATVCQFAVAVLGKENLATHYELSLKEAEFHRLLIPGQAMTVELEPLQKTHVKFSFPKRNTPTSQLFIGIDTLWGEYDMYMSKMEIFPTKELNEMQHHLQVSTHGMYHTMKTIEMVEKNLADQHLEGIYYFTFEAVKQSSFELKFFEKSAHEISIHTLTSGKQVRAELSHSDEIIYYTINLALDNLQSSSVVVNLTSLKGNFIVMANRNGVLPTMANKEFFSENGILELNAIDKAKMTEEYIIGIRLYNPNENQQDSPIEGKFQFILSLSYINKPVKLNAGTLSKHNIKDANLFVIEINDNFRDLLILKSVIDGYNIQVCGHLSTTEAKDYSSESVASCDYVIGQQEVSMYVEEKALKKECARIKEESHNQKPKCHMVLNVTGFTNQGYRIGFTYNDHPFQLVKGMITDGPFLASSTARLNFVYHAEASKEVGIYFNSKGRRLNIFSKLVRSDEFDDSMVVNFPSQANHDENNILRLGFVQNVYYSKSQVADFGDHPELLISILPDEASVIKDGLKFDGTTHFILQTAMESLEIMRTQTLNKQVSENEWNYFTFYNNGNSKALKVYVMSNISSPLQVNVSKGLNSRPPLTNKPMIDKSGVGSLEVPIRIDDMRTNSHSAPTDLRDHYVVGVKSSQSSTITIYWNNKEDLNFIELTPNEPSSMILDDEKKFYFSFYARDADGSSDATAVNKDRKDIKLYFKLGVRANVYLVKSLTGDLDVPSNSNYSWKGSTGDKGGVTFIEVLSKDANYCVECRYIGYIEIDEPGEVTMLVNIQHNNSPMRLLPGFTFPEYLGSHENSTFRLYNTDEKPIGITISMLSGFVNVYMARSIDVSHSKYDEIYSLESELQSHKYIEIVPKKYGISSSSEWFFLIDNPKTSEAVFTVTIDKNNLKTPIEPGVTKFTHIGPGLGTDYFYKPSPDESEFELRLEIQEVMEPRFKDQALGVIYSFISLYEIQNGDQHLMLRPKLTTSNYNKLFVSFSIPKKSGKTFGIRVYNPVAGSAVAVKLDLISGGYKLVNLNTNNLGVIRNKDTLIFEAYGSPGKYVFADVRSCIGKPKISFYEKDFMNLEIDEPMKYKKIKDENSFIQYVKLTDKRLFIKAENIKANFTTFSLSVFNERDMDLNPYSELTQERDGQVEIETDSHTIRVRPLRLMRSTGKDFINEIIYYVYLSPTMKVMRYAKNCGKFMISQAFKDPDLRVFKHKIRIDHDTVKENQSKKTSKLDNFLKRGFVEIKINELERNTKYYGVVVANVDLYPLNEGVLTPLRSGKAYYDEFTLITPRLSIPVQLIVSCLIILAFLIGAFIVIKAYVFGGINKVSPSKSSSSSMQELTEDPTSGPRAFTMLERAYYEEQRRLGDERKIIEKKNLEKEKKKLDIESRQASESTEDHCQDIEMQIADDKTQPLELDA